MAERKRLVIDANILIRACLGVRARALIADFASEVDFYVAEANAAEASGYIGELASHRGLDPQICLEALLSLMEVVQMVDTPLIEAAKDEALKRIRDPADWPALALAMQLECAIWTEDQDFFGTGVATWTTATVQRYLDS
jgi:predicted nucleic acid-binding protein